MSKKGYSRPGWLGGMEGKRKEMSLRMRQILVVLDIKYELRTSMKEFEFFQTPSL